MRATVAAILGTVLLGGYVAQALAADDKDKLEEVQVTGSRIKRATDFDTANPTTVVDSDYFKNLGIVNVGDAIKSLPSNVSNNSPTTTGNANFFAGSTIANLRGLNPFFGSRTLNLVNGRRFVPTNQGDGVDLNFIPSVLIDRMDVVTGGASAAYGSGAISGVNNIYLNTKLEGGKLELDHGQSAHGDAKDNHIAAAFGTGFNNGRGHFVLGFEHEKSDAVGCVNARDWCAKNVGFINSPNGLAPAYDLASNVHSNLNSLPGVFLPPVITAATLTANQLNAAGNGLTVYHLGTGATGGQGNPVIGGDGHSLYQYTNLTAPVDRNVGTLTFNYDITDSMKLSVDASYGKVSTTNINAALDEGHTFIYADNAYLGAVGSPVQAAQVSNALFPGGFAFLAKDWTSQLNVHSTFETTVRRASAGLSGKFGDSSWTWDGYYQYGHTERSQLVYDNVHLNAYNYATDAILVNGVPTCRVTQQIANGTGPAVGSNAYIIAQGCVPLNPFGTGAISKAAHDYAFGYLLETLTYTQQVAAFNTTGDLFSGFGAGAVKGAAGVEFRTEKGDNIGSQTDASGKEVPEAVRTDYLIQYGSSFAGKVTVMEAYAEADLPLLRDVKGAQYLDIDFAARESHYKNEAGANTPGGTASNDLSTFKVSGIWDPIDWLRVRATQSRDARAANFRELYYGQIIGAGGIFGFCNGFGNDPCTYDLRGNPALKPEKADTTTFGLVFTPKESLPGFQFAADYFKIKITDAIQQASTSRVLTGCTISNIQEFCDLLTTSGGPATLPTGVGIHNGPANITYIIAKAFNGSGYDYSGVDFTGTYKTELSSGSSINWRLIATWMDQQIYQPTPGQKPVNIVGQVGTSNSFLSDNQPSAKWIANLSSTYVNGPFTATAQMRYVAPGIMNYLGCEGATCTPPVGGTTLSTNSVPAYEVFGLNASYTWSDVGFAKSVQLWGTLDNVFDVAPPIATGSGFGGAANGGTNPVFYDTIGRAWKLGVRMTF